jgi:outer membrane receptor protein involved in Fe transport
MRRVVAKFAPALLALCAAAAAAQEQPRSALPPVEVPPPELAPVEVAPPQEPAGEFDRPLSMPSLSEQTFGGSPLDFGGLNSANRSAKSLFDQPNLGTIVDEGLIREKSAADMFRALQNEVGVLMQSTGRGQASPFLRGVTGQQVLILVDGVRVNNTIFRAGPNQYFNTIDPGQVERIEVIRGSGSVPWGGDAIGGVISIVTKGADPFLGDYASGGFRQYFSSADDGSYSRANVEGWVGASGLFAGASYLRVNELDVGGSRFGRQPFTDYDQYAGDVKYHYMVGEDQMVTVSLSHFEQQDLPRSDRFAPFVFNRPGNTPRPTFFDPQQRNLAYIRWQGFAASDNLLFDVFSMTGSYTRTKEGLEELRSPTQLDVGEITDDMLGYTLTLHKDFGDLGAFTCGADYYYEDIDAVKQRFNPANPAQPPSPRPPQYPDDAIADRAGAFVVWDVPITERLGLVTGARYENANVQGTPRYTIGGVPQDIFFERTYQEWIGSVGLTYDLACDVKLVGGVYEGYRAPTLDDLAASTTFLQNAQQDPVLASLAIEPEHSYTYEVGMKLDGQRLRLQAYQWWMTIDDYITREVDAVGNVFLGNSEAYLYGTEVAGEYLLPRGWALYGNFAFTFGDDTGNNVPFTRIPPAQGILGLRWRDEERTGYFDVYTWLVDRQDRYNPGNFTDSRFWVNGAPATPGYATLNLRCGRSLGECKNHRVSLVLENITNQYYRVLGSGVDGAGFNAILGYEWLR